MQIILVILAIFALLNVTESRRRFNVMGAIHAVGKVVAKAQKVIKVITHRKRL